MPDRTAFERAEWLSSERRVLAIAVFFDTAMCSFFLPKEVMLLADEYKLDVEISCYPVAKEGG